MWAHMSNNPSMPSEHTYDNYVQRSKLNPESLLILMDVYNGQFGG